MFRIKFRNRNTILYLASSLVILTTYLISTGHGNKRTPDSEGYLNMALNFSQYGEFSEPEHKQLFYWPPLYPIILSFNMYGVGGYVKVLHLIVFIASVLMWITIARSYLSFFYLSVYSLFLSLSTPLLMIHVFIWSEALFLFFISGYLFFVKKFLEKDKVIFLWISTLFCFCLLLQRHAGFFIFIPVATGLLALTTYSPKRLLYYSIHFILGLSGWIIWVLRTIVFTGNHKVYKELLPYFSLKENFELVSKEIGSLFSPMFNGIMLTITFITFTIIMVAVYKAFNNEVFIKMLVLIVSFYVVVWFIIPANRDDISRFISVVLPLLYLAVTCFLIFLKNNLPKKVNTLIMVILLISFSYQAIRLARNVSGWGEIARPFKGRI